MTPSRILAIGLLLVACVATAAPAAKLSPKSKRATPADTVKAAPRDSSHASARPSFSGTWVLDTAKTTFGNIPGGRPNQRTDVIEHDGTRIRQVLYLLNGERRDTTTYLYALDGTPTVNDVAGQKITSVVAWEGRQLHLTSKTKMLVFDLSLDERWQLAENGRTLVMVRHVKYPLGEGDQRFVFDRK